MISAGENDALKGIVSRTAVMLLWVLVALTVPVKGAEQVFEGDEETVLWVVTKKPYMKADAGQDVVYHIDLATLGALNLAHSCSNLRTQPKGLTLSSSACFSRGAGNRWPRWNCPWRTRRRASA